MTVGPLSHNLKLALFSHLFSPATYVSHSSASVCFAMIDFCDTNSAIAARFVVFMFVLPVWVRESINSLYCSTATLEKTLPADQLSVTIGQLQLFFLSQPRKVPSLLQKLPLFQSGPMPVQAYRISRIMSSVLKMKDLEQEC